MGTAYSYVRMSTPEQRKGDSLRRQTELAENYARAKNLELDTTFKFHDIGVSAFDGSNLVSGQLGSFLDAVKSGAIERGSFLLVESMDRLSRTHVQTAMRLFLELLDRGITIVTLLDNRIYRPGENSENAMMDMMLSLMLMARAHEESATKSKRLKEAWSNKRSLISVRKLTSRCPAWLKLNEASAEFELIDSRVNIVRTIFRYASLGMGSYAISRKLNENNIQCFGRSKGWRKSYVDKILRSRAAIGEFQPKIKTTSGRIPEGDVIINYFPSVIEKNMFYQTLSSRISRNTYGGGRKGLKVSNLFSKVAYCGYCGGRMQFINRGLSGGKSLGCDRARRGFDCTTTGWNYDDFETSFLAFVREVDLSSFLNQNRDEEEITQLRLREKTLAGKLDELRTEGERVAKILRKKDEPSDFLLRELANIEKENETVELERKDVINQILLTDSSRLKRTQANEEIANQIYILNAKSTEDQYIIRSAIADYINAIVVRLDIFSLGGERLPDPENDDPEFEKRSRIDGMMENLGMTLEEAEKHLRQSKIIYPIHNRHFKVIFKSGKFVHIIPNPATPTEYLLHRSNEGLFISPANRSEYLELFPDD